MNCRKIFAIKEREQTIQVWRAGYPESGEFNELILEVRKKHLPELVALLSPVCPPNTKENHTVKQGNKGLT